MEFNGVCSRENVSDEIKDRAYVINLDEYSDFRTHWIALYALNNVIYFASFGVEHIPKEVWKIYQWSTIKINFVECKHMIHNVWIFWYWIYWFYA